MKHYTAKQINEIKQEIRTGKPLAIIADDLAVEWGRPVKGIYSKVLKLAKLTRKITNTWTGPSKKPRARRVPRPAVIMEFDPLEGSLFSNYEKRVEEIIEDIKANEAQVVVQEICEEIVKEPLERQPAEIGIELPAGVMSFTGIPSRVVVYSDHVRYYFTN